MKTMYRIFDEKNDQPHTLFHGVNGSRKIPLDTWVDAEVKMGQDGSGQEKKKYKTGFHCVRSKIDALKFLDSMFKYKKYRAVCRVMVDDSAGIWPKSHSKHNIILVKRMKVTKNAWNNRSKLIPKAVA